MKKEIKDLKTKDTIDYEDVRAELLKHLQANSENFYQFEFSLPTTNKSSKIVNLYLERNTDTPFNQASFELFVYKNENMDIVEKNRLFDFVCNNIESFHYPSTNTTNIKHEKYTPYYNDNKLFSIKFTLVLPTK